MLIKTGSRNGCSCNRDFPEKWDLSEPVVQWQDLPDKLCLTLSSTQLVTKSALPLNLVKPLLSLPLNFLCSLVCINKVYCCFSFEGEVHHSIRDNNSLLNLAIQGK